MWVWEVGLSVGGSECVCTVYVGSVDVEEVWLAG